MLILLLILVLECLPSDFNFIDLKNVKHKKNYLLNETRQKRIEELRVDILEEKQKIRELREKINNLDKQTVCCLCFQKKRPQGLDEIYEYYFARVGILESLVSELEKNLKQKISSDEDE